MICIWMQRFSGLNFVLLSKFNAARDFIRYVEDRILKDKHTPDLICGRTRRTRLFKGQVCTKTIYNYVPMDLLKVKNIDLR